MLHNGTLPIHQTIHIITIYNIYTAHERANQLCKELLRSLVREWMIVRLMLGKPQEGINPFLTFIRKEIQFVCVQYT